MLRLLRAQPGRLTMREFGDYLPFKFWSDGHHYDPKLYWRTGNLASKMLDVEIDWITGEVIGVVLLLPGRVSREFPELQIEPDCVSSGYPVVDISDWPLDRMKDAPGPMAIHVDASRMLIRLGEQVEVASLIGTGDVVFELDAQCAIVGILVLNLPKQKIDAFAEMHAA